MQVTLSAAGSAAILLVLLVYTVAVVLLTARYVYHQFRDNPEKALGKALELSNWDDQRRRLVRDLYERLKTGADAARDAYRNRGS